MSLLYPIHCKWLIAKHLNFRISFQMMRADHIWHPVIKKCRQGQLLEMQNTFSVALITKQFTLLKGTSGRKESLAHMKEREKCKTTSHHRPQCAKWFSRYSISKSGIWTIWTSPFCRFLASIPLKYDVTDAMPQDIEKTKVHYLMSLLFDLFEILQAVRSEQTNFAWL